MAKKTVLELREQALLKELAFVRQALEYERSHRQSNGASKPKSKDSTSVVTKRTVFEALYGHCLKTKEIVDKLQPEFGQLSPDDLRGAVTKVLSQARREEEVTSQGKSRKAGYEWCLTIKGNAFVLGNKDGGERSE